MQKILKKSILMGLTALFTLAAAGILFVASPTKAYAGTDPVTIDVSTMGGTDQDNSTATVDSQWAYNDFLHTLFLLTADGDYTLGGTNNNLRVQVNYSANNANITFNALNVSAFQASDDCTVTLVGGNTLDAANNGALLVDAGISCTIDGNGTLAVTAPTTPVCILLAAGSDRKSVV
jgi:hypothetical protein